MDTSSGFIWNFYRVGGFDQVTLRTAEELRHLRDLDPKLWVALSCPASGLEFDQRTLDLIDSDHDGRIRIPEVVDAVEWTCVRLRDPATMVDPPEAMPLSFINADTEEGQRLIEAGRAVLDTLGKSGSQEISQADVMDAAAKAAQNPFNGDGVLPPLDVLEPEVKAFIQDALAVVGGVKDTSGQPGINRAIAEAFIGSLEDWQAWKKTVNDASSPLGDNTSEAWDLIGQLKQKIDDYFLRCEIAAYAPNAGEALNPDETMIVPVDHGLLEAQALALLPLSRVEPDRPLYISSGLNPVWRKLVERLFALAAPLLGQPDVLTREDWLKLQDSFKPYAAALARKPGIRAVNTTIAPTAAVDALGNERINALTSGNVLQRVEELARKDADAPAATTDVVALEKLVLFHRHLHRFLMNFVSFYDFYTMRRHATFQVGTLYVDGRSCSLCVPVADVAQHSTLAAFSQLYLLYCECKRRNTEKADQSEDTMTIVAAVTAGSSDLLMEGRNGVFIDTGGEDWDATVIKVVSNPIDLWEAIWSPYKRVGRMITEQVEKFASSKDTDLMAVAGTTLNKVGTSVAAQTPAAPQNSGFDIGKSAGIFAAIGLALGALGTALASITGALFSLHWWQFPLVFLGLFLLISGPAVILAWLKLRRRTLGPLLEASGWAVNSQVAINYLLGKQLTDTAELPDNADRSFQDPLQKPKRWPFYVLAGAIVLGAVLTFLWFRWADIF